MPQKTNTKTTPSVQNPNQELTPQEWYQLHSDALTLYKDAVWNLAAVMKLGKDKFGRNTLGKMTNLTRNKVNWLIALSRVPRNNNLLPEHHSEVVGLKDARRWLSKAEKENLDPVELRKEVRSGQRKVKKETPVAVPTWAKNFLLIQKEIEDLDPDQQRRIKEHIKGKL